jgi:hypothetical protein
MQTNDNSWPRHDDVPELLLSLFLKKRLDNRPTRELYPKLVFMSIFFNIIISRIYLRNSKKQIYSIKCIMTIIDYFEKSKYVLGSC